jgi:hypothetical protein
LLLDALARGVTQDDPPAIDCGTLTLHEKLITEEFTETTFREITNSATCETFRDHVAVNASPRVASRSRAASASTSSAKDRELSCY